MPISRTTLSDLRRTTAQFDFLLSAQEIKIKDLAPDSHFCVICQEPFDNSLWHQDSDTPVNQPVKLECGHIFGIQCLARLVFTSDFSNRCPLCRAKMMPDSYERNPSGQSWKAAVPLLRILMMFGGEAAAFDKKKALDVLVNDLGREGLTCAVPGKHMHRIMVLYEEFLNQFCDASQPPHRLASFEARVDELEDLLLRNSVLNGVLEESRRSEAQRQESEIFKLRRALSAIRDDRAELIEELQRVRTEGRAMFFELKSLKEEREKAKSQRIKNPTAAETGLKETQEELKTCKKDLEDARKQVRELGKAVREAEALLTGRELAGAMAKVDVQMKANVEAPKRIVSYKWPLITLEATTLVVLVHFACHLPERSVTSTSMIGLVLVQCIVAYFRVESRRRFWSDLGSLIFCVALGLVAF